MQQVANWLLLVDARRCASCRAELLVCLQATVQYSMDLPAPAHLDTEFLQLLLLLPVQLTPASGCHWVPQTVVSRETSPLGSGVLSVTMLRAGDAYNVIPDEVMFGGTIRWVLNIGGLGHTSARMGGNRSPCAELKLSNCPAARGCKHAWRGRWACIISSKVNNTEGLLPPSGQVPSSSKRTCSRSRGPASYVSRPRGPTQRADARAPHVHEAPH